MHTPLDYRRKLTPWVLFLLIALPASAADVDLYFSPAMQTVNVGDPVFVQLFAHSSDGGSQQISGLDAILSYMPAFLELQGTSNPGSWTATGFFNDPDDINDDLTDGEALFTALAPNDNLPSVPPDLHITTLQFLALAETPGTVITMPTTAGTHAETRVFGEGVQNLVTGDFSSVATIRIVPEPATGGLVCAVLVAAAARKNGRRSGG